MGASIGDAARPLSGSQQEVEQNGLVLPYLDAGRKCTAWMRWI